MIIYDAEIPLSDLIQKNNIISHMVQIESAPLNSIFSLENIEKTLASVNPDRKNFDLHYLTSLLVSSSWNGNDDCFLASELWLSRLTAKDKPFNVEHICDDIIGHMVGSYCINDLGKIIAEDTKIEDLPDILHIISAAVIYKEWDKPEKKERINKILSELKEDVWYVSVECLFPNFDYALRSNEGNVRLIARNNDTAFLTKHLRAYGGSGVYGSERVARVPRNFILSGKGLVRKPANKNSVIFNKLFEISKNNLDSKTSVVYEIKEEVKQMDTVKEKEYQDTIAKLQADYLKLKASLEDNKSKEIQANLDKVVKDLDAKTQEVSVLKASIEKAQAEKIDIAKAIEEVTSHKKELEVKLEKIESENKLTARVALCKTKLNMSEDEAKKYVADLDKMPEAAFNDHVEWNSKFFTKAGKTQEEIIADTKALEAAEKAKKDADTTLGVDQATASVKQGELAAKLQNFMGKFRKVTEKSKFQNV
jgi:hypothetical protein